MSQSSHRPDSLVVIGAGMAGIKLAHKCLSCNPKMSISILDANSYVGGRIRNFQFEGHTVEMGANWISGLEATYKNPVWKLAKKVGLQGHFSERANADNLHVVNRDGSHGTSEYLEAVDRFNNAYEKAIQMVVQQGISPQKDESVLSLLEKCGWKAETVSEQAAEYNILEVWVADGLENLSAAHDMKEDANDVDLGQDEFFVEDSRGFNCILNQMVSDIQQMGGTVHLNTIVETVQYLPGNVRVVAKNVETDQMMEYMADAVVCTVSLGVLHSGNIKFIPPLPGWKTEALNQIGMFNFGKVYAKFDGQFWPEKDQIALINNGKERYPLWMKYRNTDQPLFMCYLGGAEARRVESLTEEQLKDEIHEVFRNAFQKDDDEAEIFRPVSVAVTDWSKHSNFCGSYSYFPKGAFAKVPESDLIRGLTGTENDKDQEVTLFFAGEGFDDRFNGWVQGAYRSGERVAESILGSA